VLPQKAGERERIDGFYETDRAAMAASAVLGEKLSAGLAGIEVLLRPCA
jgi:hypothetical protein